jgi:CheY-like chemotaxis protein
LSCVRFVVETKDHGMPYAVVPVLEGSTAHLVAHTTRMGSIVVSVKDSGAGLTARQLQEICAEGVQFNANELQAGQGSGLGLFISKGIVEQHGGRLFVESEGLGKGVTFSVELPVYREPERRSSMCMSPPSSMRKLQPAPTKLCLDSEQFDGSQDHTGHAGYLPKRMLVVDDSSFNRKMLVRLLASKGYTCEQAEDGAAALKKYRDATERDEPPDAILMDFEMPVMNGPTATARLREMGCTCLIVGVTGNVLPDEQQYFRDCGADHVLPKPLVIEDFEQLLRRYPADHRVRGLSLDGTAKLHVSAKGASSLKLVSAFSSRAPSVSRVLPGEEMV